MRIDWRSIGGTTEIMRYLESEFAAAFRAWAIRNNMTWPGRAALTAFDARFTAQVEPATDATLWHQQAALWQAFRDHDHPHTFGSSIDLFFGGGTYDHGIAAGKTAST